MLLSGLRIGTFSQFMMILYILTLPENAITSFIVKSTSLDIDDNDNDNQTNSNNNNNSNNNRSNNNNNLIMIDYFIKDQIIQSTLTKSLYILIVYYIATAFLTTTTCNRNRNSNNMIRDTTIIALYFLLISYLSVSTDQIRKLHVDIGSLAITSSKMDLSIEHYEAALAQGHRELSGYKRLVPIQDHEYEFVGDLGLFYESKARYQDAEQLYREYMPRFPSHLKLQIGLIRTLEHNKQYNEICKIIGPIESLALEQSQSDNCHSIDCSRYKGHAKYALNIINNLKKKC
ncbi:hypothetical protein PPL_00544 [Heterostelium album PN500]|uniref:Uncharacterized protein n=1 Tax=Heterostelium pallidum (strain ATCC 26659 / Pp 5 / PN500) TaxID=670386 RepID=D3AWR6_HETP5|nr:hypothetical protein PPL_00544 [Heterostelium album PN500]EFA86739.1 hypothetical protein PPL_00544 [Heterostelium album PN500]|eukprot:XP_020438843.1 hypothetical protein PPL_00544 [Heterostelium album PN500]